MLQAADESLELIRELPRVIQRKAHASDVARAPARLATDLASHELAQRDADGRCSEPSAVRGPHLVAHLHARHTIPRLPECLRGTLRSLASSPAHLDSSPQTLRGVPRSPTLCSPRPSFARDRPRQLVRRLAQLRVSGCNLQQVCSGRRPVELGHRHVEVSPNSSGPRRPDASKASACRPFSRADEGARTLDLRHGKYVKLARPAQVWARAVLQMWF
jgi:hypothetical protein